MSNRTTSPRPPDSVIASANPKSFLTRLASAGVKRQPVREVLKRAAARWAVGGDMREAPQGGKHPLLLLRVPLWSCLLALDPHQNPVLRPTAVRMEALREFATPWVAFLSQFVARWATFPRQFSTHRGEFLPQPGFNTRRVLNRQPVRVRQIELPEIL